MNSHSPTRDVLSYRYPNRLRGHRIVWGKFRTGDDSGVSIELGGELGLGARYIVPRRAIHLHLESSGGHAPSCRANDAHRGVKSFIPPGVSRSRVIFPFPRFVRTGYMEPLLGSSKMVHLSTAMDFCGDHSGILGLNNTSMETSISEEFVRVRAILMVGGRGFLP
jgi:hypothetical protein